MASPYNVRNALARGAQASRQQLKDPGASGTVVVVPNEKSVLEINTTGARTLQDATQVPTGNDVLVCVTAAGVTVNGTAIGDGVTALFMVGLTAAGVHEWVLMA